MEDKVLRFQRMLLKVQDSLTQTSVQDLVFLCTDILNKDLSKVVTASNLFSLLQNEDLLSSDDPSLLMELLMVTKHNALMRELHLHPQLLNRRIPPFRVLLFDLAENISDDDLKNIKFLLDQTLPRKMLEKDTTMLQVFLGLEKVGLLSADNLDTIEGIIGSNHPRLQKRINEFKRKRDAAPIALETQWMNKVEQNYISVAKMPVQPESIPQNGDTTSAVCNQGLQCPDKLYPPSYFSFQRSGEMPVSLSSFSGDNGERQVANMSLAEGSGEVQSHHVAFNSTAEEKNLSGSDPNQHNALKLETYTMKGDCRGFCLIINNNDFSESRGLLGNREGTDLDERSLEAVFSWLGFVTEVERNCSRERMLGALENLRSRDHAQADCVVCCVLTHGYEGGVYGVDGKKVTLRELMDPLGGHRCYSLNGKPKLFFIQACQGSNEQQVVFLESDGSNDSLETGIVCDARVPRNSLPSGADFLMAMSTMSTFVSYREKARGSWFIQSLCKKLQQLVPCRVDLLYILTQVNNDVSSKTDKTGQKKQIPQPEFTLRKRLIFPVPQDTPPTLNII